MNFKKGMHDFGMKHLTERTNMCRNIKPLYNYDPPASQDDIRNAALQYVRKISGYARPSAANEEAFERGVDEIAQASAKLLGSLVTSAPPRSRAEEEARIDQGRRISMGG